MRLLLPLALLVLAPLSACSDDEGCVTDSDCPSGRICRVGLCALDPNATLDVNIDGEVSTPDIPSDCAVAGPTDLVMTEILADPPSGADPDGNGVPSTTEDEFVEVVNIAMRPVAITNVQIDVGGKRVPLGALCLGPNQARVLFGSSGLPSLTNSGGSVSLVVDGNVVQSHTYGSEGGKDSSLTLETQLDRNAAWVLHTAVSSAPYSAGTCANGNPFPECAGNGPPPDTISPDTLTDTETVSNCTTLPLPGDLLINELMADPGSGAAGLDANQDGTVDSSDDEFVEIVNVSTATLKLDGMIYSDAGTKSFTVPAGTCLAPDQALILFGKFSGTGSFPGALALSAGGLSLNNSGDTVTLKDASGSTLASVTFGAEGDSDQSIVRATDLAPDASFVRHAQATNSGGTRMSPGLCQNGRPFPDCAVAVEPPPTDATSDSTPADAIADTSTDTASDVGPGCGPAAIAGELVINEVLLDPPSGFDANGDGTADTTQDEFIEIVSTATGPIRLDGIKLADATSDRYTFGPICLDPGDAIVVFGKGAKHFGVAGPISLDTASHTVSLNNDGDTVTLRTSSETLATQVFAKLDDQSWTRAPERTGAFAQHKTVSTNASPASPGACAASGQPFPGCLNAP
jgi:hypothetical protein